MAGHLPPAELAAENEDVCIFQGIQICDVAQIVGDNGHGKIHGDQPDQLSYGGAGVEHVIGIGLHITEGRLCNAFFLFKIGIRTQLERGLCILLLIAEDDATPGLIDDALAAQLLHIPADGGYGDIQPLGQLLQRDHIFFVG